MNKFLFIISMLFLTACNSANHPLPSKSEYFSEYELQLLSNSVERFDSLLTARYGKQSLPHLYDNFRKETINHIEEDGTYFFMTDKEFGPLATMFDSSLNSKIWAHSNSILFRRIPNSHPRKSFPDTLIVKSFYQDGPYHRFLNKEALYDPYIDAYVKALHKTGFNSIPANHILFLEKEAVYYNKELHRLVLLIQLVTRYENGKLYESSQKELMEDVAYEFQKRRLKK